MITTAAKGNNIKSHLLVFYFAMKKNKTSSVEYTYLCRVFVSCVFDRSYVVAAPPYVLFNVKSDVSLFFLFNVKRLFFVHSRYEKKD